MANIFQIFGQIYIDNSEADKSIDATTKKAESSGSKVGAAFSSIAKGAAAVGTAVVAGAAAVGTAAYKMATNAAEVQTSFAKVNTLLSGTDAEAQAIFDSIKNASIETGISVTDFAESVYGAISASVDQGKAVDFTTNAIKLAKGGFTDTATAVDVLTTAINAYGLSAEDATKISDTLIMTQNLGKTTVDELASSMGKTIPVANAANVQLNDLSTQYAVMTKNGVATAEAGTQIKAMLGELSKTGSTTDKALRELTGKSFAELQGEGKNTAEILSILSESAEKNGLTLKDMFGSVEAGSAALTLVKDGGEDFNSILSEMQNAAGATEKAYATMSDTLEEKIGKVKNAFKVLYNNIGETIIPIVQSFADMIIDALPKIQSLTAEMTPIVIEIFEEVMPPLFNLIDTIFPILISLFGQLLPFLQGIITEILPVIVQAMKTFMPLIIEIVNAILPVLMELISTMLPPITQLLNLIIPIVTNLIQSLLPILVDILSLIAPKLAPILEMLVMILEPITQLLNFILPPIINILETIIEKIMPPLKESFSDVASTVSGGFKTAFETAGRVFENVKDIFSNVINFIKNVFTGNWKSAWENVKNIFGDIWNKMKTLIKEPVNYIIDGINLLIRGLNKISFDVPDWVPVIGGKTFGINISELSKLRVGMDYVPYDDYPALLHRGEQVLTASEAKEKREKEQEEKNGYEGAGNVKIDVNVTIERFENNSEQDIETLADELMSILQEKIKQKGLVFA